MTRKQWEAENLAPGETYAGLILGQNDVPDYHLILLPCGAENLPWKEATAWAKKQGAALPDRREMRLLWVNAKEHFKQDWYWSGEQRAADPDYAWYQDFLNGGQGTSATANRLRARAVRRIEVKS